MLDIKEVITILCIHLNDTVDSTLTPEHFRSAKYDKNSDDNVNAFWTTLDRLTNLVLKKEIHDDVMFTSFDKCTRTKLRMAYLQYPTLEFYGFSNTTNNSSSRELLIAFTWLISKYDILREIVKLKLLNSSLGREFSKVKVEDTPKTDDACLLTVQDEINNLLQKSNKLSANLKAISELCMNKVKLMTKVHAASASTSGLPHLTVGEMALIKKLATKNNDSTVELEEIKKMEKTASMLDIHMKWMKRSHLYYTWMSTVLDEYEKIENPTFTDEALAELVKFIYLLRYLLKKRLKSGKNNDQPTTNLICDTPSRLLRVNKSTSGMNDCLDATKNQFDTLDNILQDKKADLELKLKTILRSIPNCIQV